jgi:hypothetical protein
VDTSSLKSSRPKRSALQHHDSNAFSFRFPPNALHTTYRRSIPIVQVVVEQPVSRAKLEILQEFIVEHKSQRIEHVKLGLFNGVSHPPPKKKFNRARPVRSVPVLRQ